MSVGPVSQVTLDQAVNEASTAARISVGSNQREPVSSIAYDKHGVGHQSGSPTWPHIASCSSTVVVRQNAAASLEAALTINAAPSTRIHMRLMGFLPAALR